METLRRLIRRKKNKSILFADISDSSALYKSLGNEQAKNQVDGLLAVLTRLALNNNGKLIKTIGDELMLSFGTCENALTAGLAMQRYANNSPDQDGLSLSVGIGYGEVLMQEGDLFGEAVNDAAHLTSIAQAGQILLSESAYQSLAQASRVMIREFDRIKIKGDKVQSRIYRMYWQEGGMGDSETRMLTGKIAAELESEQSLYLEFCEQVIVLGEHNTPFYIGRDANKCDLLMEASQVSRVHCNISINRGKFVFTDHSTNGCYLASAGAAEFYLRREEYPLIDATTISLGISAAESQSEVIRVYY